LYGFYGSQCSPFLLKYVPWLRDLQAASWQSVYSMYFEQHLRAHLRLHLYYAAVVTVASAVEIIRGAKQPAACLSDGPSVRPSVRPSIRLSLAGKVRENVQTRPRRL
jgi:hypothetical protein